MGVLASIGTIGKMVQFQLCQGILRFDWLLEPILMRFGWQDDNEDNATVAYNGAGFRFIQAGY
jgi:hypothetical protein